jgi:hypothetical protein
MATLIVSNQSLDQLEERSGRTRAEPQHDHALQRAAHLLPDDRVLVEMVLQHRMSLRQVATILKQTPGTISRRLRRITNRMTNPIVDALLDSNLHVAAQYRRLGIAYFLQGQSIPTLARAHQLPADEVKQIITFLRVWHRGMSAR